MAAAERDFIPAWMTGGLGQVRRRGTGKVVIGIGRAARKTKDKGPFAAG
jgi:hypothetical protein